MGKRGPQKQPMALMKDKGYYRPSRHDSELDKIEGLVFVNDDYPMPPDDLIESESLYWQRAIGSFIKVNGWVAHSDLFMFKRWCKMAAFLDRLDLKCSKEDEVIMNAAGNMVINPIYKLRESTEKNFHKVSQGFGLDPSSRSSIKLAQQEKKKEEKEADFEI